MTWQSIEERWGEYALPVQQLWDRLTPSDCAAIAGDRARLARRVQVLYFLTPAEADRQVEEFAQTLRLDGLRRENLGRRQGDRAPGALAPGMFGPLPREPSRGDAAASVRAPTDGPPGMDFGTPERLGPKSAAGPSAPASG